MEKMPDSIRRNGRTFFCGIGTTEFFGGLPETTYDGHDTIGHGALDMNDDMEMVGHKAKLKDTYLRIVLMPVDDTLNEILAKLRLVDIRLCGIIVRYDEFTKQGFAAREGKRDMIDADTIPSFTGFLPLPLVLSHNLAICAL